MVVGQLLLIRADASAQIGTGHVMRCLALAQAWQDAGGQTCFVLANPAPSLESRLQAEGMVIRHLVGIDAGTAEDAEATAVIAHEKKSQLDCHRRLSLWRRVPTTVKNGRIPPLVY